jgi:ABC-type transport system involved in multi-copper enzyme maturation permease subunit
MFLNNNPVLQRELIVNLRTPRAFLLMLIYQIALAAVVLIAYPRDVKIDLSRESASAQRLVDFFFVGQFAIASLMAPSFTAGAISGEKERKTYEMLLASPLRPIVIVSGKLIAALAHLIVLVSGSLPIIMLCLPLGGVSIYELLAAYIGLLSSIFLFGSISMYCSSYFKRTSSSLVVSYVFILPILIVGVISWLALSGQGDLRLFLTLTIVPAVCFVFGFGMLAITAHRLLYPPDIGSQGNEVVDLEKEQREAVGLVIQRDQFPDSLFAPPRRKTLMADNANPVYDKEMHAELFSQGSLMLRLVIQISMLLAIPLMAVFLFLRPNLAAYYAGFVLIFNILVAPVFMAGSITSERERQTIDLLLTTTISSWQILWGKLLAGYRVSAVLTAFLMFPMVLALLPLTPLSENWPSMLAYFLICFVASIFNTILAMFLSTIVRKTSTSMMLSYVVLMGLYCLPVAIYFLVWSFTPTDQDLSSLKFIGVTSPLMAVDNAPLTSMAIGMTDSPNAKAGSWLFIGIYVGITTVASGILLAINVLLFQARWRLTGRG